MATRVRIALSSDIKPRSVSVGASPLEGAAEAAASPAAACESRRSTSSFVSLKCLEKMKQNAPRTCEFEKFAEKLSTGSSRIEAAVLAVLT